MISLIAIIFILRSSIMKNMIIHYIFRRLNETSTLRGIILFISGISGVVLSSQQTESTVYIVLGIVGLIGALLPDKIPSITKKQKIDSAQEELKTSDSSPSYIPSDQQNESGWGDK